MVNRLFNKRFSLICVLALLTIGWAFLPIAQAAQPSDDFIQGYASAIIAMNYPAGIQSIRVDDGVVYLEDVTLSEKEQTELHKLLSDAEGVIRVEFVTKRKLTDATVAHPKEKNKLRSQVSNCRCFCRQIRCFNLCLRTRAGLIFRPHFNGI
jgi:hypothetical protein